MRNLAVLMGVGFLLMLLARAVDQRLMGAPVGIEPAAGEALSTQHSALSTQISPEVPAGSQFHSLEVFIDPGATPLAAYQFEFKALTGEVQIVGIEGADLPGFTDPPYYDQAALWRNRVIIGAFTTGEQLPAGKTRIARLHLHIAGPVQPTYAVNLIVAGSQEGQSIPAELTFQEGVIP